MLKEEAIDILFGCIEAHSEEENEALYMAIEALKQVTGKLNNPEDSLLTADSEDCKEQKSKLDLISRAEAIEAVACQDETNGTVKVFTGRQVNKILAELPSKTDGDLISRQNAVTEIHKYFVEEIDKTPTEIDEDGDEVYTDMPTVNSLLACNKELSKRIKSIPSADRPKGECPDCIDRQELIGSIQYLFDGLADSWVEASEKIIEIIREEPTVPQKEYTEQQIRDTFNSGYSCGMQNEWITDEPPVDGQEVIATVYWTDYGDSITAYGHYNARFDKWRLYSDIEGELNKGFEVIAWMPLPEPYKGGEDE